MNAALLWGITWGALENMLYSPLLLVACALVLYRLMRMHKVIHYLAVPARFGLLLHHFSVTKNYVKCILTMIGLLFLFLALLRPQWNKKEEIVQQEGRDLFIALDISRSMLAKDCEPSRLVCAKRKIRSLLNMLSCERVGLILFSGSTFVQCPLTTDYGAFLMFLDQIDVETISSGTTAIDQAIKKALEAFKTSPNRKNKLLVLFTDGEDFSSNLSGIKREVQHEGMHIFTLGIGTPQGSPIPLYDQEGKQAGHQLDKHGNVVISRLNEGILYDLAHDSGGEYLRVRNDATDLQTLVRKVHAFEKERIEDKKFSVLQEQYPYFLCISFLCFALEWVI